jgi:hypothetical protein
VAIAVAGELDMVSVGVLKEALDELGAGGWQSIVLDLRELTFIADRERQQRFVGTTWCAGLPAEICAAASHGDRIVSERGRHSAAWRDGVVRRLGESRRLGCARSRTIARETDRTVTVAPSHTAGRVWCRFGSSEL